MGRGKFLEDTSLQVREYEALLKTIMEKQKNVPIDIKPTCAPQFVRVAKELEVQTRFKKGCLAGLSYCVITPEGLVRPCAYMTEIAGDVREESFDKIWSESSVFKRLRSREYKGTCSTCDYKEDCGGCRREPDITTTVTIWRRIVTVGLESGGRRDFLYNEIPFAENNGINNNTYFLHIWMRSTDCGCSQQ